MAFPLRRPLSRCSLWRGNYPGNKDAHDVRNQRTIIKQPFGVGRAIVASMSSPSTAWWPRAFQRAALRNSTTFHPLRSMRRSTTDVSRAW